MATIAVQIGSEKKVASRAVLVACITAVLVFLVGFVLGLDPGGGSRSDFYKYHLPAILAFRHGSFLAVLRDYSSATTPLFHILASWNPLLGRDIAFRGSSVGFSLLVTWFYVVLLRRRFADVPEAKAASLLLGAALLLSPYFQSTTYWPITDTLPVFFLLATAALLPDAAFSSGKGRIALLAVSSAAAFYTRQNYLFLPAYAGTVLFSGAACFPRVDRSLFRAGEPSRVVPRALVARPDAAAVSGAPRGF